MEYNHNMINEEHKKMLKNRYVSMVSRCKSKGHKSSYIYSDKWIKCEWETFEDFYRDMWPTFQEWLSIDRINWNWNYCKENCRWADRITQNNNRSNNIIIEDWLTLTQWSNKMWYRPLTVGAWYRDWFSIEKIKEKCRTFDWEKDRTHFETPELQKENYVTYQNWYYLNVTKKKRQERRNKKLGL